MRIVIDTNVLISGIFFGGPPRRVLEAVVERRIDAWASVDIVSEYCFTGDVGKSTRTFESGSVVANCCTGAHD